MHFDAACLNRGIVQRMLASWLIDYGSSTVKWSRPTSVEWACLVDVPSVLSTLIGGRHFTISVGQHLLFTARLRMWVSVAGIGASGGTQPFFTAV